MAQINTAIQKGIETIKQEMDRYIDEDFKDRIDAHFEALDRYLVRYRDSLKQAQADRDLDLEAKKMLIDRLNEILPETDSCIKQADCLKDRTQHFLPSSTREEQ